MPTATRGLERQRREVPASEAPELLNIEFARKEQSLSFAMLLKVKSGLPGLYSDLTGTLLGVW